MNPLDVNKCSDVDGEMLLVCSICYSSLNSFIIINLFQRLCI